MERSNYLLKPRLLSPRETRNFVEGVLQSIDWWAHKRISLDEALEDPWRAKLDLDGAEIPDEDFEDGFNATGVTYRQLRNWNLGDNTVEDEWEPADELDRAVLVLSGETIVEEKPKPKRASRRQIIKLRPLVYMKYVDGKHALTQKTTELWWGRSASKTGSKAHLVKRLYDIKETSSGRIYRMRMSGRWQCSPAKILNVAIWQGSLPDNTCLRCAELFASLQEETASQ